MSCLGVKKLKRIRYDYLIESIHIIKPQKIIEIGLAQGLRSFQMIKEAKIFNKEIEYCGYDVFDTKDQNWHKMVGNGKKVSSQLVLLYNNLFLVNFTKLL